MKINSSKAQLEFDEKNDEFEAAELALSDMQAVHLASKLTSRMSRLWLKKSSKSATGKKISLGLDESFRAAKQNLDLVKSRYSKAKEEVASAETSV